VSQRQLPDFIQHLYKATVAFAERKQQNSYKDPGFEYPPSIRLDDFDESGEESMEDNVNLMKKIEYMNEVDVEEVDAPRKSWWNYFYPLLS
jgi:hypothetical protein